VSRWSSAACSRHVTPENRRHKSPKVTSWADVARRGRFVSRLSGYFAYEGRGGGVDPVIAGQLGREHPLAGPLDDFLADLANTGASAHTLRACLGDLLQFAAHHDGEAGELDAAVVRAYLTEVAELAAATRKRKRAAVASFCRWAVRHDLLPANPMDRIDTIKVPKTLPGAEL
jgi:hypothetical protein